MVCCRPGTSYLGRCTRNKITEVSTLRQKFAGSVDSALYLLIYSWSETREVLQPIWFIYLPTLARFFSGAKGRWEKFLQEGIWVKGLERKLMLFLPLECLLQSFYWQPFRDITHPHRKASCWCWCLNGHYLLPCHCPNKKISRSLLSLVFFPFVSKALPFALVFLISCMRITESNPG